MMTGKASQVLQEALELPTNERAEIAAELMASLDGESDADVEQAWAIEIQRRAERAAAGFSSSAAWGEVRARIEGKLTLE